MLHVERMYLDPFTFKPERWLDNDGKLLDESKGPLHPNKIVFGFGRRICPGRYFAENTIFNSIACILSVFDIRKALDVNGSPITPVVNYSSGNIRRENPNQIPSNALLHGDLLKPRRLDSLGMLLNPRNCKNILEFLSGGLGQCIQVFWKRKLQVEIQETDQN